MFCNKCGSDNLEDAKFCRNCGELLTEMPEATNTPAFKPLSESDNGVVPPDITPVYQPEAVSAQQPSAASMPLTTAVSPKKKSSKKALIILTSVLLVLLILCAAGFLLRNQIIKAVMPEQYLQMSIARSAAQSQKGAGQLLDFSKYATGAVKHEFSFEQDSEDGDFSADGTFMYDAASEKALLNVSVGTYGTDYDENILYISKDQIALSIPSEITDTDFLTVDPATFNDEWEEKGYDELSELPDVQGIVNTFFGKTEDGNTVSVSDAKEDFLKFLKDDAEFATEGAVTEEIGGVDRKLDVMTYTISKDDADERYQDLLAKIEDKMSDASEMYASSSSMQADYIFDELKALEFKSDIKVAFYIDQNGYINRIEIDKVKVEADGSTAKISMVIDTWSKDGTTYTSSEISIDSGSGSETLSIETEFSFKDGVYLYKADMEPSDESSDANTELSIEMEWDTKEKKGENLSIVFEEDSGYYSNEISLTGNLVEDKSKISLSDATIEMTDGSDTTYTADVSYSLSKIDAKEITVDTSDSTPILSYKPFEDYMDMVLSYNYDY